MDRRSLIFVVALTIALFFVNQWFSSPNKNATTASPPPKTSLNVQLPAAIRYPFLSCHHQIF